MFVRRKLRRPCRHTRPTTPHPRRLRQIPSRKQLRHRGTKIAESQVIKILRKVSQRKVSQITFQTPPPWDGSRELDVLGFKKKGKPAAQPPPGPVNPAP